jgi:hypothetical protein
MYCSSSNLSLFAVVGEEEGTRASSWCFLPRIQGEVTVEDRRVEDVHLWKCLDT